MMNLKYIAMQDYRSKADGELRKVEPYKNHMTFCFAKNPKLQVLKGIMHGNTHRIRMYLLFLYRYIQMLLLSL